MEPMSLAGRNRRMAKSLMATLAAAVLVFAPDAEAKFEISLSVTPARPVAGGVVRVIMRTEIVVPERHGMRLNTVGPWRTTSGQGFFEPRLVRMGLRVYTATFRFPYPGRWRLIVPNWGAPGSAWPPPVDRRVVVRPRR